MSRQAHPYTQYWDTQGTRVIECQECGFKHVDPLPSAEQLTAYYRDHYYQQVKPFNYGAVTTEYLQRNITRTLQNQQYRNTYEKTVELLREKGTTNRVLLDIGAGNSILAVLYQHEGWRCVVVEPNAEAADFLRKHRLDVIERYVYDMTQFADDTFDFINLRFVLEHIVNPIKMIQEICRVLKPGGVFRVCVPNDFSVGQLAYHEYVGNDEIPWVATPDHINYFTFESMNRLLERCGLLESYRTTTFPVELLLLGGIDYYNNKEESSKVGAFIKHFQNAWEQTGRLAQLNQWYDSLAHMGMGRSVEIYARKME